MDIGDLDLREASDRGSVVSLRHPGTGEPLGISLRVLGYESAKVDQAVREYQRKVVKSKDKPSTTEFLEGRRRIQASASVIGVEGGSGRMGSIDGVREYIDNPGFVWLVEQIEAVAGDRASFFTSAEGH